MRFNVKFQIELPKTNLGLAKSRPPTHFLASLVAVQELGPISAEQQKRKYNLDKLIKELHQWITANKSSGKI